MSQQEQSRESFLGFLDGVLNTASQTAQGYWATKYGSRTEQVPPDNTVTNPDVDRASSEPTIAGVPQSTLLLGFGGLLLFALLLQR
ncbi:MAG: hypothetical protein LC725_08125 [Lentisphaerae bacterium]|nr:hypothetical protein [Lentisphaerota bacterium]